VKVIFEWSGLSSGDNVARCLVCIVELVLVELRSFLGFF